MSLDTPIRKLSDLPEPQRIVDGWKVWRGYIRLDVVWKEDDGKERLEEGGFVPHSGLIFFVLGPKEQQGWGWTIEAAIQNAKENSTERPRVSSVRAEFQTRDYEMAHGKKPRGGGNWAFSTVRHPGSQEQIFWIRQTKTFAEAKKAAREHFAGAPVIYVLS